MRYLLLLFIVVFTGCMQEQGPSPQENNHLLQVFIKPFTGHYFNTNPFDHHYPLYNKDDDNNYFIDYKGNQFELGWDGHNGNDWPMPTGTPILSVADGEVIFVGSEECTWAKKNGDTLLLRIRHTLHNGEVYESTYGHVSKFNVKEGDHVKQGQEVALAGNTGCSSGPHLHLTIKRVTNTNNGLPTPVDPFGWEGIGNDPWEYHIDGAQSLWLWKNGMAPYYFGYQ